MKKYVVGLVFDPKQRVMLIEKNRPDWQKGYFNGVGGEINNNETPINAMIRECKEESGLEITNWQLYDKVVFPNGIELNYFCSLIRSDLLNTFRSMTDEQITVFLYRDLPKRIQPDIRDIIVSFIDKYKDTIEEMFPTNISEPSSNFIW